MTHVVYVNEYQPSSASLRLGNDPIYKQSRMGERIRVGEPSALWLTIPLLAGLGIVLYEMLRR